MQYQVRWFQPIKGKKPLSHSMWTPNLREARKAAAEAKEARMTRVGIYKQTLTRVK